MKLLFEYYNIYFHICLTRSSSNTTRNCIGSIKRRMSILSSRFRLPFNIIAPTSRYTVLPFFVVYSVYSLWKKLQHEVPVISREVVKYDWYEVHFTIAPIAQSFALSWIQCKITVITCRKKTLSHHVIVVVHFGIFWKKFNLAGLTAHHSLVLGSHTHIQWTYGTLYERMLLMTFTSSNMWSKNLCMMFLPE